MASTLYHNYLNISMKLGIINRINDQLQDHLTNLIVASSFSPDLTISSFINSPVLPHYFLSISPGILLQVSYPAVCSKEFIRTLGFKSQKP